MAINPSAPSVRCSDPPPPALIRGVDEFNGGRFFEQHETLEDAWIEESDPVRYLYQGILQIGVGFYHLQRGNFRGATRLLERGMGYLQPFSGGCMGVDVSRLLADTERARSALLALGPERMASFNLDLIPEVHFIDSTGGRE